MRLLLPLLPTLLLPLLAPAATYHVSQLDPAASDTNDGSAPHPWKSISRAASAPLHPGDTVLIADGTYRESVHLTTPGTPDHPIRFAALPASTVIITGADRLTSWTREPGPDPVFSTPWPHSFVDWNPSHTHPADDYHLLIGRCEQVLVLSQPLRQVLSHAHLARGTFFADLQNHRLYAWSPDNRDLSKPETIVEASTRDSLWTCPAPHVQTAGLTFRYAANHAQQGAATFTGPSDLVEDCTFELTNAIGATFAAPDLLVRRCTFRDNGQLGFAAGSAHRLHLTECTVTNNNTKRFDRNWEAGGDKIVLSRDVLIDHSTFSRNHGPGLWFDIGNEHATVHNCLISDNEDAGLFYEISYSLHAHDNVITGNGLAGTPGAWGAAAGICLSSSPDCLIERNLLVANKEGFNFREQGRTTPHIDDPPNTPEHPIWCHDETVQHNTLAYNRDAQTYGWFDVPDDRIWPSSSPRKQPLPPSATRPATDSLESLHLHLTSNLYALHPGQLLLHWGTPWHRHQSFTSLDSIQHTLNLEQDSQLAPFIFSNYPAHDFRLPPNSPALTLQAYPQGTIPNVRLGTLP